MIYLFDLLPGKVVAYSNWVYGICSSVLSGETQFFNGFRIFKRTRIFQGDLGLLEVRAALDHAVPPASLDRWAPLEHAVFLEDPGRMASRGHAVQQAQPAPADLRELEVSE